jgi:hypothetical protein
MKYTINLIRQIRQEEHKALQAKNRVFTLATSCLALMVIAVLVVVSQILAMKNKLSVERQALNRVELEYSKYRATKMVVEKADIERLDSLQSHRIFWTRKLAAMAFHLPNDYWITKFGYDGTAFKVSGYGYISPQQEQLITLDEYLNMLRVDSTYNDVFRGTFFNSVVRADDHGRCRVSFEYSSGK